MPFLFRTLRINYAKTAKILKIGAGKHLFDYPNWLESPLDGIIYRLDRIQMFGNDDESDFDSDVNMNGTSWHTADDL